MACRRCARSASKTSTASCPSSPSPPRRWPTIETTAWPPAPATTSPSHSTSTSCCRWLACGCRDDRTHRREPRADPVARRDLPQVPLRLSRLRRGVDDTTGGGGAGSLPLRDRVEPAGEGAARAADLYRAAALSDGAGERPLPGSLVLSVPARARGPLP